MRLVTLDDIRAARSRIGDSVLHTPLVPFGTEGGSWLKAENLQSMGAFKIRGALNALASLPADGRDRGVVAYSSGNHAQAVALAARTAGVPAVIVVDDTAPARKVTATRALGAEVVTVSLTERATVAAKLAAERGAMLVPPFDDPDVIAGQGTIGLEIVDDLPDVDVLLVPISGGGLASGIGVAVKALRPETAVFGVEPALAGDTEESFRAGHLVRWPAEQRVRTIADGLRAEPSELTFAHLRATLDGVLTVTEEEIRAAVGRIFTEARLVAEPAGAVATAAYLFHGDRLPHGRTVAVVSGGNIAPGLFREILTELQDA